MSQFENARIAILLLIAIVSVAGIASFLALTRHLRERHPTIWQQFGFPSSSFSIRPKDERADAQAQLRLISFLFKDTHRRIADPRLTSLILRHRTLLVVGIGLIAVYAINLIVSNRA